MREEIDYHIKFIIKNPYEGMKFLENPVKGQQRKNSHLTPKKKKRKK